jgi:hypothetical protein
LIYKPLIASIVCADTQLDTIKRSLLVQARLALGGGDKDDVPKLRVDDILVRLQVRCWINRLALANRPAVLCSGGSDAFQGHGHALLTSWCVCGAFIRHWAPRARAG